jgi:periplasmic nitrate reductase NapD
MARGRSLDRRRLLRGRFAAMETAGRSPSSVHHISSAVVTALPRCCDEVVGRIKDLPDTEVHRVENGRIVIVMEGASADEIGGRLAGIAVMDGVISANLVFEQIETFGEVGDQS